jgi:uncharacterized protein YbjT (DUF2867 family)
MAILVTGATGYIGNAVAGALVRRGHQVTGTTRWIAGDVPAAASRAREDLGWTASGPILIDELAHGESSRLESAEAPR